MAKEAIQETLLKHLKDKEYSQIQAEVLSKTIASEIKDRLKGFVYFHWQINKFNIMFSSNFKIHFEYYYNIYYTIFNSKIIYTLF